MKILRRKEWEKDWKYLTVVRKNKKHSYTMYTHLPFLSKRDGSWMSNQGNRGDNVFDFDIGKLVELESYARPQDKVFEIVDTIPKVGISNTKDEILNSLCFYQIENKHLEKELQNSLNDMRIINKALRETTYGEKKYGWINDNEVRR